MWNISAEPIPSRMSTPNRSLNATARLGGSASPADSTRRSERNASATLSRPSSSMPFSVVGTAASSVGRWRRAWAITASGFDGSAKSAVVAPTANGNIRLVPVA